MTHQHHINHLLITYQSHINHKLITYQSLITFLSTGKLDESELVVQDSEGNTPLHLAARYGVSLYLDLLAPKGIERALVTRNQKGKSLQNTVFLYSIFVKCDYYCYYSLH